MVLYCFGDLRRQAPYYLQKNVPTLGTLLVIREDRSELAGTPKISQLSSILTEIDGYDHGLQASHI